MKKLAAILFGLMVVWFNILIVPPVHATFSPDINGDGVVNSIDASIIIAKFNNPYTLVDYSIMLAKFGQSLVTPSSTPIPSPTPRASLPPVNPNHINVGAIYFSGSPGETTHQRNEIEGLLAFDKFKHAWPYFTIVRNATTIDIHEDSQAVMDQEINLAGAGGLDYFAFLLNAIDEDETNYGLKNYLDSPNKHKLKFAIMPSLSGVVNLNNLDSIVNYINSPEYLRVTTDARPLIYVFNPDAYVNKVGVPAAKERISNFVTKFKAATGKKPILVAVQDSQTATTLKDLGFEDKSFYIIGTSEKGIPYDSLTNNAVSQWNQAKKQMEAGKIDIIPTATTGYDPRPKGLNPQFHGFGTDPNWAAQGTPAQIAGHIKEAVGWVKANPGTTHTKTVLIYAWNEFAEGGWLTPNTTDDNSRLNAISKVLGGKIMPTPVSPYKNNPPAPHAKGEITITSPTSGSSISGSNIVIKGTAPNAARITIKFGGKTTFFINGKTGPSSKRPFAIKVPDLPTGTYTLTLESKDTNPLTVKNIKVK